MDITWGFIGYLAAYRLSIVAVGALSIALGYRLFCKGLYPHSEAEPSEFNAKFGETEISLTSAGPGLFFALFGVIVISVMIVQGNPEFTLKQTQPSAPAPPEKNFFYQHPASRKAEEKAPTQMELTMRGTQDTTDVIQYTINQGKQLEREGKIDDAILMYQKALILSTPAMNGLAWLYITEKNDQQDLAELLSKVSVRLCPNEGNYWDTLATILLKNKQYQEALIAKKKAAALDKTFEKGMELLEKLSKTN
ncbi:MAG: hypothetical protein HQK75_12505 [Candidatus Magnetomorum sp.]|nr:hypothetical protein [Candidatus Magnetomorum sp.]